eukprot:TRINITY_DN1009_c1_g1_i1.p1 TRINITY_DN1009_c1_g1~~TRINITY_DN1009_c1_g1_i1.p1  ORF type:complete len:293 (+),score=35.89 TRINITY_DN1009_c1_g1_i1:46-924(+)
MESVPKSEWLDGDCCTRCEKGFKLTRRKHHCRLCGKVFCDKCTRSREEGKRVCWDCVDKLSTGDAESRPVTPEPTPSGVFAASPRDRISSLNSLESSVRSVDVGKIFGLGTREDKRDVSKDKDTQHLQTRVLELENQLRALHPEYTRVKNLCTEAKQRALAYEELKMKEESLKRRKAAMLRENRETADIEVSERKQEFEKGTHHLRACEICAIEYTVTRREHHCRVCYKSMCGACSRNRIKRKQRACCHCFARFTLQSKNFSKHLRDNRVETLSWLALLDTTAASLWETVSV